MDGNCLRRRNASQALIIDILFIGGSRKINQEDFALEPKMRAMPNRFVKNDIKDTIAS